MRNKPLNRGLRRAVALAILAASAPVGAADQPDLQQMWQLLQTQQAEIQRLKAQNQTLEERLNATGERVEKVATQTPASSTASAASRTKVGGYGELHYNNLDSKKEMDFHRFVLFFGHQFNDRIRFQSELEVEHVIASRDSGDPGEVEVEQAYIEFDLNDRHRAKGGLFLMPVGILNETHEPTTFYGVERNPVEKNIIPATWWEGGAALSGLLGNHGLSYDVALTSGLKITGPNYAVRSGRQKVAEANANDLAVTGRLRYTGIAGLELAATVLHQSNVGQSLDPNIGAATLFEGHAVYQRGPFGLRALYATWDIGGSGPAATGADRQTGWYVEPSYKIHPKVGLFTRYSRWDNRAGSANSTNTRTAQWNAGVNYWPHEDVVLKFDVQNQSGAANDDGFNLGIGYQF